MIAAFSKFHHGVRSLFDTAMFSGCARKVLFKRQAFNAARNLFYTGHNAKNIVILQSSNQGYFTIRPARSFSASYYLRNDAQKDFKCSKDSKERKEAKGDSESIRIDENMASKIKDQGNTCFISCRNEGEIFSKIRDGYDVIVQRRNCYELMDSYLNVFGLSIQRKDGLNSNHPWLLVLTPTGKLANQVAGRMRTVKFVVNVVSLCGGDSISYQEHQLKMGTNVVVGTPGVVIDQIQRGSLDISKIKYMVFQDVDTMINMGFNDDMDMILKNRYSTDKRDKNPQTLFFAATIPSWVHDITEKYLRREHQMGRAHEGPVFVCSAPNNVLHDFKQDMEFVRGRLHSVREKDKMYFYKLAEELMKKTDSIDTFAKALAVAGGRGRDSLIDLKPGFVTLEYISDTMVHDSYHAFKLLPEILAREVRNIRIFEDNEGFVFDVPVLLEEKYTESRKYDCSNNISVIDRIYPIPIWKNSD